MTQAVVSTAPLVPGCLAEVWAASRLRGADPPEVQTHGNLLCGSPLKDTHSSGKGRSEELRNQASKQGAPAVDNGAKDDSVNPGFWPESWAHRFPSMSLSFFICKVGTAHDHLLVDW